MRIHSSQLMRPGALLAAGLALWLLVLGSLYAQASALQLAWAGSGLLFVMAYMLADRRCRQHQIQILLQLCRQVSRAPLMPPDRKGPDLQPRLPSRVAAIHLLQSLQARGMAGQQAHLDMLPGIAYRYEREADRLRPCLISAGCDRITGHPPAWFLSSQCLLHDLVTPDQQQDVRARLRQAIENRQSWDLTYSLTTESGRICWVRDRGSPICEAGASVGCHGFLVDITSDKEAEKRLRLREETESLIASQATNFLHAEADNLPSVIRGTLRAVGVYLGVSQALLFRLDKNQAFSLTSFWCSLGSLEAHTYDTLHLTAIPNGARLLMAGDFLHIPDIHDLPEEANTDRQYWHSVGLRALLAIPVVQEGRTIGMLAVVSQTEPRPWQAHVITLLRILAEVLSSALQRQQNDQALALIKERFDLVTRVAVIYDLDLAARTYSWQGLHRLLGIERETSPRDWLLNQIHPDDRQNVAKAMHGIATGHSSRWDIEYRLSRADTSYAYVHDEAQIFLDDTGRPTRMVGVLVDVSQLREAVEAKERSERDSACKAHLARISRTTQGVTNLKELVQLGIGEVCELLHAGYGAFYLVDPPEDPMRLQMAGAYARGTTFHSEATDTLGLGEGLAGQCAKHGRPIQLEELPPKTMPIITANGPVDPHTLLLYPVTSGDRVVGVIELALLQRITDDQLNLLVQIADMLGAVIQRIRERSKVEQLLIQSRELTKQLSEKSDELHRRQRELAQSNRELEQANRYKSEFLANISHELRTPLNSLLLLARQLAMNPNGTLTAAEQESAGIIHQSGRDLLSIINELLDLAKIEAGKMQVYIEPVDLQELAASMQRQFKAVMADKGLDFRLSVDPNLPQSLHTDRKRSEQVLRNLIGNAVKFTETGSVELIFTVPPRDLTISSTDLRQRPVLAMTVRDTGIGIPADRLEAIFQAFQQAEGGTSRRYGGTGLGLSICREIALLLEGEVRVQSREGEGSSFTFIHPLDLKVEPSLATSRPQTGAASYPERMTNLVVLHTPKAPELADVCTEAGLMPVCAETVEVTLRIVRESCPCAILMEPAGAADTVAQIRRLRQAEELPIYLIESDSASDGTSLSGSNGVLDLSDHEAFATCLRERYASLPRHEPTCLWFGAPGGLPPGGCIAFSVAGYNLLSPHDLKQAVLFAEEYMVHGLIIGPRARIEVAVLHTCRLGAYPQAQLTGDVHEQELQAISFCRALGAGSFTPPPRIESVQRPTLPAPDCDLTGHRAILIHDDMRTLFAVASFLRQLQLDVMKADTIDKAMHMLTNIPTPDILICAHTLLNSAGPLLKNARALNPPIPIVAISDKPPEELGSGILGCQIVPATPEALQTTICQVLARSPDQEVTPC